MNDREKRPAMKAPGTPRTPMPERFPARTPDRGPAKPGADDPTVPNRAHTEMRTEFPPEFPLPDIPAESSWRSREI